jgi:hypothetical protein
MLFEIFKRLRGVVERCVGKLRKRILEVLRELRIQPIPDTRIAHDVQQAQVLLEIGATEEPLTQLPPVLRALLVTEHRIGLNRGA